MPVAPGIAATTDVIPEDIPEESRIGGFSMLELVIALAMAAVLAAYAVPAYVTYTARGHRVDAVIALHRAAQYVSAGAFAVAPVPALALPPGLDRIPATGRAVYRLDVLPVGDAGGGYELRAVPLNNGPMRGDACGTFVLDGLGVRSNLGSEVDSAGVDACWSGRAA